MYKDSTNEETTCYDALNHEVSSTAVRLWTFAFRCAAQGGQSVRTVLFQTRDFAQVVFRALAADQHPLQPPLTSSAPSDLLSRTTMKVRLSLAPFSPVERSCVGFRTLTVASSVSFLLFARAGKNPPWLLSTRPLRPSSLPRLARMDFTSMRQLRILPL